MEVTGIRTATHMEADVVHPNTEEADRVSPRTAEVVVVAVVTVTRTADTVTRTAVTVTHTDDFKDFRLVSNEE